jgi:integrase
MPKLTKRIVEKIVPNAKDVLVWDDELRGFGIRVKSSGVRSYIIQYRNQHGRSRRLTIGRHGPLTAVEARKQARLLLVEVAKGNDPAQIRQNDRNIETFKEFADRYFADYAPGRKKASTIVTDEINLRNHLLPALGKLPVPGITRADVIRWHQKMKDRPGAANRTLCLLSHMMNVAEQWGLRTDGTNPCRHVEKYKSKKRERFLSVSELGQLGKALRTAEQNGTEPETVIAAIRLLIFTGCRRGEILTVKWEYVDFENECLRLPDSKTGAKIVHLNAPSLAVLKSLGPKDKGWVIAGRKPEKPLVNLKKPWSRIRKAANIEDVRIHDLRHSFASVGVTGGLSLPIIGALLGHSQPRTTARYAHLAADPVKQASKTIADRIAAAMDSNDEDNITSIARQNR